MMMYASVFVLILSVDAQGLFDDLHMVYQRNLGADLVTQQQYESGFHLLCSPYLNGESLKSAIGIHADTDKYHPVYLSKKSNNICYVVAGSSNMIARITDKYEYIRVSTLSLALKLDGSIYSIYEDILSNPESLNVVHVEASFGLGVLGKGLSSEHAPKTILNDILATSHSLKSSEDTRRDFIQKFTFAPSRTAPGAHGLPTHLHTLTKKNQFSQSALTQQCDFSYLTQEVSQSHVTYHISAAHFPSREAYAHCMLQFALLTAAHTEVSHVTSLRTPVQLHTTMQDTTRSESYTSSPGATDQNAYVQSAGVEIPYSSMGLDGTGYVLGMIDTGIDDLSCFLRNEDGSETPRTKKENYWSPITERNRRKVIQYVAWADSSPKPGRDHGTWCGGAAVGKCLNTSSPASAYNGLAHEAKITVFDVDDNDNWLVVPSLYDISLPPAYDAGARVHTNSWGTPGMGSYTSKAIDIDRFMGERRDFLFVVAAGNDGRSGYTSIHSPGVSKNALTVGASAASPNHDKLIYFSGIGYNYDQGMIKPDIIAPGTSLMSAGVRIDNETESCNVQQMSGTSMATPIVAAAAIMIRQYFENASFWSAHCRTQYRSCPYVSSAPDRFISGALLKAAIIHSGEGLTATLSSSSSVLSPVNLSSPPDRYQGWGQVLLSNLLPIPELSSFDLYVADNEELKSMTRRSYTVSVRNSSSPLRVTICWTDPVNVVWSAKNLLNDLDLRVTSPSGSVRYGNDIAGDEYNPVERVVIAADDLEIGNYTVDVLAHQLVWGVNQWDSQTYGIVITCSGEVVEELTSRTGLSIKESDLSTSDAEDICQSSVTGKQLVKFQLEDWQGGKSWIGLWFVVSKLIQGELHPLPVFNCTFPQNELTQTSDSNRIAQCEACLDDNSNYIASLETDWASNNGSNMVRVSGQCNDVYLSSFQQRADLDLFDGKCNLCSKSESVVTVLMHANVTDDDFVDYSWHGEAHYQIKTFYGSPRAAGTLIISDEQADRYCVPEGMYTLALEDTSLFRDYQKHAKVAFHIVNRDYTVQTYTLEGTTSLRNVYIGPVPTSTITNNEDTMWYDSVLFVSVATVLGVVMLASVAWLVYRRLEFKAPTSFRDTDTDNML